MNRLLIIINKQLNNNPNSPTIPFFPTKTHHSPPCWGGVGGRAFKKNLNTMKNSNKETLKTVLQFIVSVITALLATLGVQSCVCN